MKLTRRKFMEFFGKGIPAVLVADRLFPKVTEPEPEPYPAPATIDGRSFGDSLIVMWDGSMTGGCSMPVLMPNPLWHQGELDL